MADALLVAYRTGTPGAMERHYQLTWHRRAWSAMRTYVQIGLGRPAADDIDINLDGARWAVAREHGFESWPELLSAVNTMCKPGLLLEQPMATRAAAPLHRVVPLSTTRDWSELLHHLQHTDAIGLDAHGQMTDDLLRDVVSLSQLTAPKLGDSQGVTDEGIRLLAAMSSLHHLDLSGTSISDRGVRELASLTSLRHLSLAWTRVTDDGIASLSQRSALEHVDLSGTQTGNGAIATCAGTPALRHFAGGPLVSDARLPRFHDFPILKEWHGGETVMALTSDEAEPNRPTLRGRITDHGVAALAGLDGLFAHDLDDSALALTGAALALTGAALALTGAALALTGAALALTGAALALAGAGLACASRMAQRRRT